MNIPAEFSDFSDQGKKYILDCQPVDGLVPEKSTKGGCSPDSHMFVSDGGSVEDNLDETCLCGARTAREMFGG